MKKNTIQIFVLLSLGTLLFLEILHAFIGVIIWNLDYYVGGPEALALSALAILGLVFLAIPLQRKAGPWKIFLLSFFILGTCRGLFHLFTDPLLRIVTSSLGVISWLWLLVSWYGHEEEGLNGKYLLGISLGTGTLLDLAIRAWLRGYDILWRRDSLSLAISLLLITVLLILTALAYGKHRKIPAKTGSSLSPRLFLLGPWLFLSMALFHNIPAIGGAAAISDSIAAMTAIAVAALTLVPLFHLMAAGRDSVNRVLPAASAVLLVSIVMLVLTGGTPLFWTILGGTGHMLLLASIFGTPFTKGSGEPKTGKHALAVFLMFFVLIIFVFLYGELKLREVHIAAAGIFFIAQLIFLFRGKGDAEAGSDIGATGYKLPAGAALFALLFALLLPLRFPSPLPLPEKAPRSLKVMTYNIHQAFDCDYRVDLEKIAEVIKGHNADIVCLQEVNRGQIVAGMIDSLALIRDELRYHCAYGTNHDDGQYGNAILSRYPLRNIKNLKFKNNIYETRGVLRAEIAAPGTPLQVFVTHLDFLPDNRVRTLQAKEVLEFWQGKPRSIICGDLNAEPDSSELAPLYASGLKEASRQTGRDKEYTFHESRGEKPGHIDYLFYTDDMTLKDFKIDTTRASDHMPLVMEVLLKKD